MGIDRIDPNSILVLGGDGSAAEKQRSIDSDFQIRSGLCPNRYAAHGGVNILLEQHEWGQECPACGFSTNRLPEPGATN